MKPGTLTYSVARGTNLAWKQGRTMNLITKVENENAWKQAQEENLAEIGNEAEMHLAKNSTSAALSTLVETMSIL